MTQSLVLSMYRDLMLSITRGSYCGHVINAKPIYLLSIFSLIENDVVKDNRLYYNEELNDEYGRMFKEHTSDKQTPLFKPFVFMGSEPFYHLKWRSPQDRLPHDSNGKFVRENIEYAYLDNALWDLLQEKETRDYLKETIINFYLK